MWSCHCYKKREAKAWSTKNEEIKKRKERSWHERRKRSQTLFHYQDSFGLFLERRVLLSCPAGPAAQGEVDPTFILIHHPIAPPLPSSLNTGRAARVPDIAIHTNSSAYSKTLWSFEFSKFNMSDCGNCDCADKTNCV